MIVIFALLAVFALSFGLWVFIGMVRSRDRPADVEQGAGVCERTLTTTPALNAENNLRHKSPNSPGTIAHDVERADANSPEPDLAAFLPRFPLPPSTIAHDVERTDLSQSPSEPDFVALLSRFPPPPKAIVHDAERMDRIPSEPGPATLLSRFPVPPAAARNETSDSELSDTSPSEPELTE